MKSLQSQKHQLSDSSYQLSVLEKIENMELLTLGKNSNNPIYTLCVLQVLLSFQMNIGKMCNQTCKHCHVDAGPDRKEVMSRETMQECLNVLKNSVIETVDITGGAPEMNPNFRWLVEEIYKLGKKIMVRCNLTIIEANKIYYDLPEFFKENKVEVVSSLPFYTPSRTNNQRGEGVFEKSIKALNRLNEIGYGKIDSGLILNLVYNPAGAFLPSNQSTIENEFRKELKQNFGIEFNNLFAITNLPISRFLEYLLKSGNYEAYMTKLIESYNGEAAKNVMCRNTISIGWDGYLYDCDFNQMLELKLQNITSQHIRDFNKTVLDYREISVHQHCFGCTAGEGSSCGGTVV